MCREGLFNPLTAGIRSRVGHRSQTCRSSTISTEFGLEPDADLLQAETVGDLMQTLQDKGAFRN